LRAVRPWEDGTDSLEMAVTRVRVAFELMEKLGTPFYCFHDRDVAPEGKTLAETNKNLDAVVKVLKEEQERTGIRLLWGTANLFSNPRYVHGAATSPNADVFRLRRGAGEESDGGHARTGRGQLPLLGRARRVHEPVQHRPEARTGPLREVSAPGGGLQEETGLPGQLLIEPKPKEPTTHQYDFDAASCLAFLRGYGLADHFKLNIETNHAPSPGIR
jgi:xylose isomerase